MNPEKQPGDVLVVDGDLRIVGDWDASKFAAVIILGNCQIDGLLFQFETEPWFVVTGDLIVHDLVMAGNLDVGGGLKAMRSAEFESNNGYAHIARRLEAQIIFVHDMSVTCDELIVKKIVSVTQQRDHIVSEKSEVTERIGRGESIELFADCILDLDGYERAEAFEEDCVALDLKNRKLVHLFALEILA